MSAKMVKEEPSDSTIGQRSMSTKTVKEEASDSAIGMKVKRLREPDNFILKVETFSKSQFERYESDEFEAGGYKWKLILYPKGDKERNGRNYISLYLSICDTQNLPPGWEVEADFSLFVYNSLSRKYRTFKLADKAQFDWLNMDSGFARLMALDEFKEASNGYLFGDSCVFGAEVHVTAGFSLAKRQTLSLMKKTDTDTNVNIFTWTVRNFSTVNDTCIQSEKFIIQDVIWVLRLFPKGIGVGKDKSLSLYLSVADGELAVNRKFDAEFQLRIKNQLDTNHVEKLATHSFCNSEKCWGSQNFMLRSDLTDKSKGFLMNDSLVAEVEITRLKIMRTL